jgi:hypothetical protein
MRSISATTVFLSLGDGAELQVFLHRHGGEGAALRHMRDAGRTAFRSLPESGLPSNSIAPVDRTMLQIARKVVVLPAPLAPSSVVRLPSLRRSSGHEAPGQP